MNTVHSSRAILCKRAHNPLFNPTFLALDGDPRYKAPVDLSIHTVGKGWASSDAATRALVLPVPSATAHHPQFLVAGRPEEIDLHGSGELMGNV